MNEQIKYIVEELNLEPYKKNLNLIIFDALAGDQLLQIVSDVLAEVEDKEPVDIREEEANVTVLRILNVLRLLKYKPPAEVTNSFREGVLQGYKEVMYPLLEWLLKKMPDLKKRAYLAKYLVKVDVPQEVISDPDVELIYAQYEELIDTFKTVHKECETVRNSGYSPAELRKDIEEMESEREAVLKRVERMERKVDGLPNSDTMLEVARKLRKERERETELRNQKLAQRTSIQHQEQRIQRLQTQLAELRQSSSGTTTEGLIQKLEEEAQINNYMANEKLPKEISAKKKIISSLDKVNSMPAMGQDDIKSLKEKIKSVNEEATELIEKRNVSNDPTEDKLALFRQQAAIIGRKKESTADKLNATRGEVSSVEEEISEKKEMLKTYAGDTMLKGDDFKRYVTALRGKSSTYKRKKAEMADIQAEVGVLNRTIEILRSRGQAVLQHLSSLEKEKGIAGFRSTQDEMEKVAAEKANVDMEKGETLENMSDLVDQLTMKISQRKARLAPIIKELRPLRQQNQELLTEHEERKHNYDTLLLQLESGMSRLEQEVNRTKSEIADAEMKRCKLLMENQVLHSYQKRAMSEMSLYAHGKGSKKNATSSVRDRLLKQITEQEKKSKHLKEEQKSVKDNVGSTSKQVQLWGKLERLFECKRRAMLTQQSQEDTMIQREPGTETLVL